MDRIYREYLTKYAFAMLMMCRGQLLGCSYEAIYWREQCDVCEDILREIERRMTRLHS